MALVIQEKYCRDVHRTKKKKVVLRARIPAQPEEFLELERVDPRSRKKRKVKLRTRKARPAQPEITEEVDEILESGEVISDTRPAGRHRCLCQIVDDSNGKIINEFLADDMATARAEADAWLARVSG